MGKKVNLLLVVYLLSNLCGCATLNKDFETWTKNYDKIPLHKLNLGNSKNDVEQQLGKPINVIGSKRFEEGVIEVWSYEKWQAMPGRDRKEEEYWLYFLDGRLEQWGRPGDWEKEADKIYELRINPKKQL